MLRVNIICFYNAHGLAKDGHLMAGLLRENGYHVIQSDLIAPPLALRIGRRLHYAIKRQPIYDINIHVESCVPALFHLARKYILVPNLAALRPETAQHLDAFDAIFCKTTETHSVLSAKGLPAVMVGFSTPTNRIENHERNWHGFFHASSVPVPGGVGVKGTESIYQAWKRRPDWPLLTITGCHHPPLSNINCVNGYVQEKEYAEMQRRLGVHLCLSEMEGFGHYIVEPMSLGSVVVTTDGAPMNELVTPDRGFLVKSKEKTNHMFGTRYKIDEVSLENTIDTILKTSEEDLRVVGTKARAWYVQNDVNFRKAFIEAIDKVIAG
jgi:hypothetical protein